MSSSPKYVVYRCGVCTRETELVLDGNRPDPSRCNITKSCRGKLTRVGERSVREFLFTPIVPGLADYVQRGSTIVAAPQLTLPNPVTVFTAGGDGIIALAGIRRASYSGVSDWYVKEKTTGDSIVLETNSLSEPKNSVIRAVLFEISPALLSASKFIYVRSEPITTISGSDSSADSKSLRFTTSNKLTIFVNGVELDSTKYSRAVDNQITFTPSIYDNNNVVEIFVYQDLSISIENSTQVSLTFRALVSTIANDVVLRQLDCWGNYFASKINNTERYTLFCTDFSSLNNKKSYGVKQFEVTDSDNITRILDSSQMFILLGNEPFSVRDKELYAYLRGTSLVDDQSVLTYQQSEATGEYYLTVDSSVLTQVFNPISATRLNSIASSVATGTALPGSDTLTRKYIIGPA